VRCRQDEGRINACDPHRVPLVFRICEDDWENSVLCRDRVATSLVIAKGNSKFKLQSEHESSLVTATYGVCPKCCAEEALRAYSSDREIGFPAEVLIVSGGKEPS